MSTLKEISSQHLFNFPKGAIETARRKENTLSRKIVVMHNQECIFLKIDDIACARANGAYTDLHLMNGECILVCKNLKVLAEKLPENEFYRVHKSYIINTNAISRYVKSDGGYIILENGMNVPVSIRKKEALTDLIDSLSL